MRVDRSCRIRWPAAAWLFACLLAVGCDGPAWQTKDISNLMPPLAFQLMDERGRTVQAEDYRGRVTLLFFGYAHCPDICPNTLARLSAVSEQLDAAARRDLRILFVSVDPARDTPAVLQQFTAAFGEHVVGLTGNQAALDTLTRRYRATYGYGTQDARGNYPVSHPSAVYAFDRQGRARLLIRASDAPEAVATDLRRLLAQG